MREVFYIWSITVPQHWHVVWRWKTGLIWNSPFVHAFCHVSWQNWATLLVFRIFYGRQGVLDLMIEFFVSILYSHSFCKCLESWSWAVLQLSPAGGRHQLTSTSWSTCRSPLLPPKPWFNPPSIDNSVWPAWWSPKMRAWTSFLFSVFLSFRCLNCPKLEQVK